MLKSLFSSLWEKLQIAIKSRLFYLSIVFIILPIILIYRLFQLQIVNGQDYLDNFELRIRKERTVPASRGRILDRNGEVLAYNELAYSVTIEDVYEAGKSKNSKLNDTIYQTIQYIEQNGDQVIEDFGIGLDEDGEFYFKNEGKTQLRFLADIYGLRSTDDLKYEMLTATPDDVIMYLCSKKKYGIGRNKVADSSDTFEAGYGYTKSEILKLVNIRYAMSLNGFQKYISTTIATDVCERTVAVIMENRDSIAGVNVEEDTIRKYVDGEYFSQIIGYTGRISPTELTELKEKDDSYNLNDHVGKDGIEQYMELELQGNKGKETVYVDNMGKVIDTSDVVEPSAGNDVYLTIDKKLQKSIYKILEQKIAGILVANIKNVKYAGTAKGGNVVIPIYEVYYALINNTVIDVNRFSKDYASDTEKQVNQIYIDKKDKIIERLKQELLETNTSFDKLTDEYQAYEKYVVSVLEKKGVIDTTLIDKNEQMYIDFMKEEKGSLKDYLNFCISKNYISLKTFVDEESSKYASTDELYQKMIEYVVDILREDKTFSKKIYYYLIMNDEVTGKMLGQILLDQDIVYPGEGTISSFQSGKMSSYDFMLYLIRNILLTPAQLALDPCSGSCVMTDVNTGEILALVSYPSYDNNRLANTVDSKYYNDALKDLSNPFWNYATQQKTAPGSTFKMVTATAGLEEGVIRRYDEIYCSGRFDKMAPTIHHCWISPGSHGALNVVGGIQKSCNCFFYEVGYRLSQNSGSFDSDYGLERIKKYADLYGLTTKSGIEIKESEPGFSTQYSVPSSIGQGNHNFTTVGLARYVTTIANSGDCYNLTLLSHVTDCNGHTVLEYKPEDRIASHVDVAQSTWDALHEGMRKVVQDKAYFNDLGVAVAGKTGTAQEDKTRPNHAVFVCYAPYKNPEVAMSVRIAFGYSSSYAAETAKDILQIKFGLADEDTILSGKADQLQSDGRTTD